MANPSPYKAREGKARKRLDMTDPGNLQQLRCKLWAIMGKIEEAIASTEGITSQNVRIVYAFTQVAATFAKVREIGELEARVAALEAVQGKRA